MKIKQILVRIGVLAGVFIAAILIFSLITNRGSSNNVSEMDAATLPRIYFEFEGHAVNHIAGYVNEMDITAMRDTVIPIANDGTLTMQLDKHGNTIDEVSYEIYNLTGEDKLTAGTGTQKDDSVVFDLRNVLEEAQLSEAVMKVMLTVEERNIYYYLRVVQPDNLSTKACLDYASDFHNNTFNKEMQAWIERYLETDSEREDNTTYQTVTIYSDSDHVMWGTLNPTVIGDVVWSIKESNQTYTSILAEYQVECGDEEGNIQTYNVREFFRIRVAGTSIFLLNYNRTMDQLFEGQSADVMSDKGILLGITDSDLDYEVNEDGTTVAFVQERELWVYNQKEDELSKVFAFAREGDSDIRCSYNQHEVRIISMDDDGSTTFAVYGYMNRGEHEGEVGVDVFYYNLPQNSVEEKAFIPTNKSFAMAEEELGKLVYYSHSQELLYVLAGGTLYRIELDKNKQEEVVSGLEEGQYTASTDGHLIAFQTNGKLDTATVLKVINLETGTEQEVTAGDGECLKPLGFIFDDLIYGLTRASDAGKTISGDDLLPMFRLEIRNRKNKVVKTYEAENTFISDIAIDNNQITVNRVTNANQIYTGINADYITNNEEKAQSNIALESFSTEAFEKQYRLTFADGVPDRTPKFLTPGVVVAKQEVTVAFDAQDSAEKYLVFGTGEVAGIYDKASYAIAKADELCGVVITTQQKYVWVRGNRDLSYQSGFPAFTIPEGLTSYQACEQQLEQFGGTKVDLTGCNVSQICYLINQGIPVIAMTDVNTAILLTGYTETAVTYIDPASGSENTVSVEDMTSMVAGSGNTFVGYIR
ncbi:MAG: papain-like cysteine protease family protein [Hespellia sp.]|nr:papain-like cysteine protease family protein [Hespellia sp.]